VSTRPTVALSLVTMMGLHHEEEHQPEPQGEPGNGSTGDRTAVAATLSPEASGFLLTTV